MIIYKNKCCDHCGKTNCTVYGYDEIMSMFCCLDCEVYLSTRCALPYYELWENEELILSKINFVRSSLLSLSSSLQKN